MFLAPFLYILSRRTACEFYTGVWKREPQPEYLQRDGGSRVQNRGDLLTLRCTARTVPGALMVTFKGECVLAGTFVGEPSSEAARGAVFVNLSCDVIHSCHVVRSACAPVGSSGVYRLLLRLSR